MKINSHLIDQYTAVRQASEQFCAPLAIEDYGLQAAAETSPPKWHLAHTSWFFETFLLGVFLPDYQSPWPDYAYLFNSYYNGIGEQFPRPQRGLLSRPTLEQVYAYRHWVDEHMVALLSDSERTNHAEVLQRTCLGINHEQQHQELFFTDLKYSFSCNPMYPVYRGCDDPQYRAEEACWPAGWHEFSGGECAIGHQGEGFCFDNELPVHRVLLQPFMLATRPVTNADYLAFINAGGYQQPEWWLADGWTEVQQQRWQAPLYWRQQDGEWLEYTLHGLQPLRLQSPVVHVSAYEADAFARWAGCRLPSEAEWEYAARTCPVSGQFVESEIYQPVAVSGNTGTQGMFGSVWEWTSSSYSPYPGFSAAVGAVGEYNGKFMCNQLVLRGGSCVSSQTHLRSSYRNFFYPRDRWQFSGIRLARNAARMAG
ncbi:ergothioneine biosynthesis protein EgtB [Haliea sp. E1-2-M8]|uniref:ergothioneine biosynthesis protein EgtB n=1 Tax=Haliea sp. E1-2-M8 TaxID=3064706 RepID=UPI0027259CC9|nr:ergothioneine biosynthesis protein EgtB [Haliea sp. E1-2-M8]MDO8861696.1 ergothioneine biosynthesis protein EgtB [Haliea sp. E1-2-M8]